MTQRRVAELEAELEAAKAAKQRPESAVDDGDVARLPRRHHRRRPRTSTPRVPRGRCSSAIAQRMTELPAGLHARTRRSCACSSSARRWARASSRSTGAWASCSRSARCSYQGVNVRLTGQDCARGTFSHRHAVVIDINDRPRVPPARPAAARSRGSAASTTRRCPRRACSASSSATRSTIPTRSSCGRRSSATSSTARR